MFSAAVLVPAASSKATPPDVPTLARRATKLVHAHAAFKKARLLEAQGITYSDQPVKTPQGVVNWVLVFDNRPTGGKYASVDVLAHNGKLSAPHGEKQTVLDHQVLRPIPKMTFVRALRLLNKAGYTHGFYAVTLRKPLYPGVKDAEYIFTTGPHKFIAVDTKTGKVKRIS